ncbi:MAG TPA: hypothetical protein VHU13_01355 [Solirubrobacteraceae bacterium]|jgi:hypothetical protein|nr:hypothetical protein [Solirubrobacteraceae bacterium]
MPENQPILLLDESVRTELRLLADKGLWDIEASKIEHLRRLSIFGGSDEALAPLTTFRAAFRDFLKTNEELAGALSEMAVRLIGAEQPYRDLNPKGRVTALGEVEWQGGTVFYDAARRAGGRRDKVLDRIASAIVSAETTASEPTPSAVSEPDLVRGPVEGPVGSRASTASIVKAEQPTPASRLRQKRRRKIAWPVVVFGTTVVAAVFLVLGVWVLLGQGGKAAATPPLGSVVDASNGRVYPRDVMSQLQVASRARIEGMESLGICNSSIAKPCEYPEGSLAGPLIARPTDTLTFRVYVRDPIEYPIPLLRVRVSWERTTSSIYVTFTWQSTKGQVSSKYGTDISFAGANEHNLVYVSESSALYAANAKVKGARLVRLPDGIMSSSGIILADVGPTPKCLECVPSSSRIIEFSARVV